MKALLEHLTPRYLFASLVALDQIPLGSRRSVRLYQGVDLQKRYHMMVIHGGKSRFAMRHVEALEALYGEVVGHVGHAFWYKHLFAQAPFCSKALHALKTQGWKVYHDLV